MRRFIVLACMMWGGVPAHADVDRRDVTGFDRIELAMPADLTLVQGSEEGVVIEASESALQRIRSRVRNGKLILDLEPTLGGWFSRLGSVEIKVSFRDLKELEISGSGEASAEIIRSAELDLNIHGSGTVDVGLVEADQLGIRVSGSGEFDIDAVDVGELRTEIDGSGRVQLGGAVDVQHVEISGSGEFDAEQVETGETKVAIHGSGSAQVWAVDGLDVEVNGSGSVRYRGEGTVREDINGSGKVQKI